MRSNVAAVFLLAVTVTALFASARHVAAAPVSEWSAPATLIPDFADKYGPYFTEAATGDALLAYLDAANASIVAYNYTPSGGWSGPLRLTNASVSVQSMVLVSDPRGNGTLVATIFDGITLRPWSFHFAPGLGWTAPTPMPVALGNESIQVAMAGANGDVFATIDDFNDTIPDALFMARYAPATGWDPNLTKVAEQNASGQPIGISLAVGPSGQAAFVFAFFGGPFKDAYAVLYAPSVGWGSPRLFPPATNAFYPAARYAGSTATFYWTALNGTHSESNFQTYSAASGWSVPSRIENFTANVTSINVVGNNDGNLTAVFLLRPTATNRDVWASHYTPYGGWEPPVALDTSPTNSSIAYSVAAGRGDFFVVWVQGSGSTNQVMSTRYVAERGWQPVTQVAPQRSYLNYSYIGTAADGTAICLWTEVGAPYAIRYATFSVDDESPPITVATPGPYSQTGDVVFSGTTELGASVWVNGTPAAVDAAGNFTLTLPFAEGTHTVEIIAGDYEGNLRPTTATFTVDLRSDLTVEFPHDAEVVTFSLMPVRGSSEAGSQVTINGAPVPVNGSGAFSSQLVLNPGSTSITVRAVDLAGNVATIALRVTYIDLIGALSVQLANLTTALDALVASGNATQAQLDGLRADLASAQAQLVAANASQAADHAALVAATANLTAAQAKLDAAQTNLTVAQARLADAQAERDAANARAQTAPASGNGALDVLLAVAAIGGVGVGLLGMMMGRRKSDVSDAPSSKGETIPPKP